MKRELREKLQGAPHLVPLPKQAVAVLRGLEPLTGGGRFIFRGERHHDRPMSENTINAALRAMGFPADEVTGHGFRATARTMLHERLGFSPEIIEAQLAHSVRDSLGRAYNRTEFTEQRRAMLQAWADYLDQLRLDGDAVPMRAPAPKPSIAPASVIATPPPPAPTERPVVAPVLPSPMGKQELSTIEAAKFLNASHLFIAQEIDAGRLKCRQVGVDWRIAVSDLVTYALRVRLGRHDDAQRS
ncbi:MAG: hypothetical protein ACSLE9_04980 [Burkholderiaceae bacterium]